VGEFGVPTISRRRLLIQAGSAAVGLAAALAAQACLPHRPTTPTPTPAPPQPTRVPTTATFDTRFGAVEAYRAPERADAIGVSWMRLVFAWNELQKAGPGSWNRFYFRDDLLDRELASGRQVVGVIVGTPAWAGDGTTRSVPHGLDLPPEDPGNGWAAFCNQIAERYRGRIDHWVLWNEPDVWDESSPAYTWSGSVEACARLVSVGYRAMKRANPDARVALPGLTYWWDEAHHRPQYFGRLLEALASDPEAPRHGWYFDAVVLHLYNEPEGLARAPARFREILAERGLTRQIWVNETNVTAWDDPARPLPRGDFRVTMDEQASFIVQAFALGLASGVERISVYPFVDAAQPSEYEPLGLVRTDHSTRPAYDAYRAASRYFRGVRPGRIDRAPDHTLVTLDRDDGRVSVAWANGPRPATASVKPLGTQALLVNRRGDETILAPEGGAYRLPLEAATTSVGPAQPERYVIGGSPLILVEHA
jgi:hypothetical protein